MVEILDEGKEEHVNERREENATPAKEGSEQKEKTRSDAREDRRCLFPDGASNNEGAGGGLVLIDPNNTELTYALRFEFKTSNNGAEYEARIAGLKIARSLNIKKIKIYVDSKLVESQIDGSFKAKEPSMQAYLGVSRKLLNTFDQWKIKQVPRSKKKKADSLSKLALVAFVHLNKEILVELLKHPSIEVPEVNSIVNEEESWMDPIVRFLNQGKLPEDTEEARKIEMLSARYTFVDGSLYKRSYLGPLMKCLGPVQGNYLIREIHEGSCGLHSGPRMVVAKQMNLGYFWPTMHQDASEEIRRCKSCQQHALVQRVPKHPLIPVTAAWPFCKWGMDIVGAFPEAKGRVKFVIVAIDYFKKWIEAKAVATITGDQVLRFVWENLVCRFGLPRELVTGNGKQFANNPFKDWCEEMQIKRTYTSVYYRQANGQFERANRSIVDAIKARLTSEGRGWLEQLTNVLLSHRTMPKTSNGEATFSLTYGLEAMIPVEIGIPSYRYETFNEGENDEQLRLNLNLTEERREMEAVREAKYKQKLKRYYDRRVRPSQFNVGDYVW